ncbi:hypothetical protein J437_LFUL016980, partial [Ladona fulva]
MDRDEYTTKCLEFIKANNVMELPKDPTPIFQKNLKETLNSIKSGKILSCIDEPPNPTQPPKLYGLPKIHKSDIPVCP